VLVFQLGQAGELGEPLLGLGRAPAELVLLALRVRDVAYVARILALADGVGVLLSPPLEVRLVQ
jgi:hypothetical protein